jgi:hypothetical protein
LSQRSRIRSIGRGAYIDAAFGHERLVSVPNHTVDAADHG